MNNFLHKDIVSLDRDALQQALRDHEYALRDTPDCFDDLTRMAELLIRLNDTVQARIYLKKSLRLYPDAAVISQHLARLELGGLHYLPAIKCIHEKLKPRSYVEVGVWQGSSFNLASLQIPAVGIDPEPDIDTSKLPQGHVIVATSSDNYFQNNNIQDDLGGLAVDLAFIDGMHLFEYALRDFMNLEKCSTQDSTILLHDCYPLCAYTSQREQKSGFWSGDVWKLLVCLKEYRPDLGIVVLPSPPTGLAVIQNLDPSSKILIDLYDSLLQKYIDMSFSIIENDRQVMLNLLDLKQANCDWYAAAV